MDCCPRFSSADCAPLPSRRRLWLGVLCSAAHTLLFFCLSSFFFRSLLGGVGGHPVLQCGGVLEQGRHVEGR